MWLLLHQTRKHLVDTAARTVKSQLVEFREPQRQVVAWVADALQTDLQTLNPSIYNLPAARKCSMSMLVASSPSCLQLRSLLLR